MKRGGERSLWEEAWHSQERWEIFLGPIRAQWMAPAFVSALLRLIPPPRLVLEAGAGTAASSAALARRTGAKAVALDLAYAPLPAAAREGLLGVQAGLERLPFPDGAFDLAWNISTLEHFREPLPILAEMARVGRSVAAAVPGAEGIWTPLLRAMEAAGYRGAGEWYRLYRKEEIRRVFLEAELGDVKVLTIRFGGVFPFHLAAGTSPVSPPPRRR